MIGKLAGSVFGMTVRIAHSPEEWSACLALCRAAGGIDVGAATRSDYDLVINEKAGLVLVNPRGGEEIIRRLLEAIPQEPA